MLLDLSRNVKGYIIKYATTKQAMILGNKEIVVTIIN